MGYKRSKLYTLAWEEGEYEGLEVVVRSASVGRYLEILDTLKSDNQLGAAVDAFASVLVSWNMEDEHGNPIAATRDGVLSVDLELMTMLVKAWQDATTGGDVPKDETSRNGSRSAEQSLPMEPLSASRAI